MADENISSIKLTLRADKKNYFSTSNINPGASDSELKSLANAINSLQNKTLETITKTVSYRLLQS